MPARDRHAKTIVRAGLFKDHTCLSEVERRISALSTAASSLLIALLDLTPTITLANLFGHRT